MINEDLVSLVDRDDHRRSEAVQLLRDLGPWVLPYRTASDLERCWPTDGIVLVHDDGPTIERILDGMAERDHWLPVIAYSSDARAERVVDIVLRGAVDFLVWPFSGEGLRDRLTAISGRQRPLAVLYRRAMRAHALIEKLTPRQQEVLFGVANGATNKCIARDLHLSPRTVEIHRANMMHKLGARTAHEAVTVALFASIRDDQQSVDRFEPQLLSE